MQVNEIIQEALSLPAPARFEIAEQIMFSLVEPDPEINRLWVEEAMRRLTAYRAGLTQGVPAEEVLGHF